MSQRRAASALARLHPTVLPLAVVCSATVNAWKTSEEWGTCMGFSARGCGILLCDQGLGEPVGIGMALG